MRTREQSEEQEERAVTGEVLFEEICTLLSMTEQERMLAAELMMGPASRSVLSEIGFREHSPVFVQKDGQVFLHPVFLAAAEGRMPEEKIALPPGMELRTPQREILYGGEQLAEEMALILGNDRPGSLCMVLLEDEERQSEFLAEQAACCMRMPLLIWDGREADWEGLYLAAWIYDALICLDIRESCLGYRVPELASRAERFLLVTDSRKTVERFTGQLNCLFRRGVRAGREDREACIRDYRLSGGILPPGIEEKLLNENVSLVRMRRIFKEFRAEQKWSVRQELSVARAQEILEGCYEQECHVFGLKRLAANRKLKELCLPGEQSARLSQICKMLRQRSRVMETWGFREKYAYGNGMTLLFYGAPGTGKTMAAQAIAGELDRPLYRVDLSRLISKYIGETQKNIEKIFQQAGRLDGILLFDEADALFAKRNEVNDAQDKYSNAETAYLLQKIEEWDGVCILATNLLQNFDEAFRRRITYMVNFPLPDEQQRIRIWQSVFPEAANLETDLCVEVLAEHFELSGAAIRSAVLQSAYLAAAEEDESGGTGGIGMRHVLEGICNEYVKLNRIMKPEQRALLEKYRL